MNNIATIFSILLVLNTASNSNADLLGELLGGIGVRLGESRLARITDRIRDILRGILDLAEEELKKLVEVLDYLKGMAIEITEEKLKEVARRVNLINQRTRGIWIAKMGFFSLLPEDEQMKLCGVLDFRENEVGSDTLRDKRAAKYKREVTPETCTYEVEFDVINKWKDCASFINYIQDQGFCGGCWAVTTASVYTDRRCIERAKKGLGTPNNVNNTFSSFDLLSCAMKNGDCRGGWPEKAWEWIKSNGICTGTDFPDKNGCKPYPFGPNETYPILKDCLSRCSNSYWGISYDIDRKNNITSVGKLNGEQSIKEELQRNGPVVANLKVYKDFYSYVDGTANRTVGVYYRVSDEFNKTHAVVITGYGTATCGYDKIPYWIIRNSWGTKFNTKGFLKIRRGNNECGIEEKVSFGIPKIN